MSESVLVRHHNFKCRHNKFIVDARLGFVECGICSEKLNPMWVLEQLCEREHRAADRLNYLNNLADKAAQKNRCKCEKCGEMTRIQRQ